MAQRLHVGSKVLCRYFNKPEGKFYGGTWEGEVMELTQLGYETMYNVTKSVGESGTVRTVALHRKEILTILS